MNYKNNIISTKNERLTSGFGMRPNPTNPKAPPEQHNGADFTDAQRLELKQDVDIIAIADGTVVEVINGDLVGWTVAISHEGRILSRYQHMKNNSVKVKIGDKIKKGQTIGIMGMTGRTTGIHLHLGIKENSTAFSNGVWVDPIPYLDGRKNIAAPNPQPPASSTFKAGDRVKIKGVPAGGWGKTYDGGSFRLWHAFYEVIQVAGDRVVIGIGKTVTAAVKATDLVKA